MKVSLMRRSDIGIVYINKTCARPLRIH